MRRISNSYEHNSDMITYRYIKRFFDVFVAIILLLSLAPFYLIIALVIYIQDSGPAIFRQKRVGKDGEEFMFYKFRSMPLSTPNVESRETSKISITPFGKFIRRTNLDELPQLYNVINGEMSFIGPRPSLPTQIELIEMRKSNGSLTIKPGLTGWAQVNSFDGMSVSQKAKFDGEYIQRVSFLFDLLIFYKTLLYFTRKPPTY